MQFIVLETLDIIEGDDKYFHLENIKIYLLDYGLFLPSILEGIWRAPYLLQMVNLKEKSMEN